MSAREHRNGGTSVSVDEMIAELTPAVEWLLKQIQPGEFTTTDFIELMISVPRSGEAYTNAVSRWGEGERASKMVIHGQVIPAILRHSPLVEWVGYAHELEDAYAVPAWWKIVAT
ncbi:MAG: hypothetical protein WKF81_00510 [Thermomicrobiales bacterium]